METLRTHRAVLGTALATALVTAGVMTLYQSLARKRRRVELADSELDSLAQSGVRAPPQPLSPDASVEYDEELIHEQLARNYAFFGADGGLPQVAESQARRCRIGPDWLRLGGESVELQGGNLLGDQRASAGSGRGAIRRAQLD